jgi:hypothetical protein
MMGRYIVTIVTGERRPMTSRAPDSGERRGVATARREWL